MQKNKNLLIEVKDIDVSISPTILYLSELLNIEKIYFYYFEHNFDFVSTVEKSGEVVLGTEKLEDKILSYIENNIQNPAIKYTVLNVQGDIVKSVLQASLKNDIDLILFEYEKGTAKREEIIKITKYAYCSVLVIPTICSDKIKNILIPVDFSEYSRHAVNLALEIANTGKFSIVINHVYFVPSSYHATGKSYEESALNEKQLAKKECQKFLKDYNLYNADIFYSYILDDDKDPTDKIYKDAVDNETDLIIIGAKGKTQSYETLTGSIAFSLLLYNQKIPTLIIKNKKDNYDLAEDIVRKI